MGSELADLSNQLPHGISLALAIVLPLAGIWVLSVVIARIVRCHRAIIRARDADAESGDLKLGHTILRGRVRTEDGAPAIVLEVHETGEESKKRDGSWVHTWTEAGRKLSVRAFDLVVNGRTVVRVVPHGRVVLKDDLEVVTHDTRATRIRRATISHGEDAYLEGDLRQVDDPTAMGGYRGEKRDWVLRFSKNRPALVSTQPLDEPFRRWRRFWTKTALAITAAIALVVLATYDDFWGTELGGVVVTARVTELTSYVVRSRGDSTRYYVVRARPESPERSAWRLEDTVSPSTYRALHRGDRVAFVVDPSSPSHHEIGTAAHLGASPLALAFFVAIVLGVAFVLLQARTRRWYEMKKIVKEGKGRLPEPDSSPRDDLRTSGGG